MVLVSGVVVPGSVAILVSVVLGSCCTAGGSSVVAVSGVSVVVVVVVEVFEQPPVTLSRAKQYTQKIVNNVFFIKTPRLKRYQSYL